MKNSAAILSLALLLGGCSARKQEQAPPPPQVFFVSVAPQSVTLSTELPGRTSAFETSEVRPQVNGLIQARLFKEGDTVRAGQPLYRIDPAPYQAQVASARAALLRARAATGSTQALARRYGELVKINAISRQEFENATTGAQQAQADVAAQQAALHNAQIDLARTTVRAPISGRIGRSAYTTGALVTASQTDALTTIQRLDPIYVDINQSSADLLRLRKQVMDGQLSRGTGAARVRLMLEDGSEYPLDGHLQFADVTVSQDTGTVTIRALFPNPQGLLLPGMFVRAQMVEGTTAQGILVPQQAIGRDEKGSPTALVVGVGDKLEMRQLTAPRTIGDKWLVTRGLKAGDRVVTEGAMMLRPGAVVKPVPWSAGKSMGGNPQGGAPAAGK
jgi:membrane fusion protein, multidrug efflux system